MLQRLHAGHDVVLAVVRSIPEFINGAKMEVREGGQAFPAVHDLIRNDVRSAPLLDAIHRHRQERPIPTAVVEQPLRGLPNLL